MTGRRLTVLVLGLAAALLAVYLVAEPLLPASLTTPSSWPRQPGPAVAAAMIALLAADVVLPVPSSVVMTASGAAFGFAAGTVVSTVGATTAALIGFGIGRATRRPTRSWLGAEGATRLDRMLHRHGLAVVIATRPIPIVAETVAVLAGSGRFRFTTFAAGAAAGSLVTSAIFAGAGAAAVAGHGWLVLPVAVTIAAIAWLGGERLARRPSTLGERSPS